MDTAKQIADTGSIELTNLNYFKMFPNNIPILAMVTISMKIF